MDSDLLSVLALHRCLYLQEAQRKGRQGLQDWVACQGVMVTELARERDIVLTSDQMKLLDEARNSMLRKMYGGNIESIMSDRQWLREVMHIDDLFDTLMVTYGPSLHSYCCQ